ncbi:MAG: tRNA (N6-isopentenyl adenosine(37)-C2)-methylthiotransferase MiaB [Deltaproteobacteria bacterium]|nr:tRNA (N6-isopentenyl adenosine(37)-C2)-methylthiotransferase MiaB [Deltaproteobacteria bacterium]
MKRLYIQTYGCQMNQHDSDRILRVLGRTDYAATDKAEEADVILLNTCSVRDRAEQKVYSALGRWRELKEKKKDLIIGVGGCVAQQEGEDLLRRLPYLDLVFGTHNIHRLGQMVEEVRSLGNRPVEIGFYRDPSYMEEPQGKPEVKGAKALVTIMQGCNKVCSFCIVPHVRGREISRAGEKIVREIRELVRHGVKEVMLLGQNVNSYGKMSAGELTFPQLLRRINSIEGLERIRFTTSHPQDLSLDLIEAYASLEKLCGHLHLPVQSGSDRVLQRMRRGYSRREYMEKIRRLRERCPEVALSTDIIAGFPGETEGDFEQTLEILREVEYIEIFAFTFSPRPQTVAAKIYPDDVPGEIKKRRLEIAQNLQHDISLRKNREKIGSVEEILVEGRSKLRRGQIMGRTRTNRIVNAAGPDSLAGKMVDVRIIGASANSLLGELVTIHQRGIA